MVLNVTEMKNQDILRYLDSKEIPALRQNKIINIIDKYKNKNSKNQTESEPMQPDHDKTTIVDGTPCGDCGNTQFLRTGTCHVCLTCGTSQGCS